MKVALGVVVALVAGASCIDSTGPKEWVCTDADSLTVTVGPGATPRISWTPGCSAFLLLVADSTDLIAEPLGELFWGVASRDPVTSFIPPSLVYGTLPPNTAEPSPARALQAGTTYQVMVGSREGQGTIIGLAYFRP